MLKKSVVCWLVRLLILCFYHEITVAQSYILNKDFYQSINNQTLNTKDVHELKIVDISMEEEIVCFESRAKDSLSILKLLSNLQILQVEQLNIGSRIDTSITFHPYTFEEIIQIYIHQNTYSAYSILPYLEFYPKLQDLSLNFLDNFDDLSFFMKDFNWFITSNKIEGPLTEKFCRCLKEHNIQIPSSFKYKSLSIDEIWWAWQWDEIFPIRDYITSMEELYKKGFITRAEYCQKKPESCQENQRDNEWKDEWEDILGALDTSTNEEALDTAFLRSIGEWPPPLYSSEEEQKIKDRCRRNVIGSKWKKYGKKYSEIIKLYDLSVRKIEFDSFMLSRLSKPAQKIIKTTYNSDQKAAVIRKKYHIRRLFAKDLWQTLSPWKAKDRNQLLLQQLVGLKALKKLKISNNFLLDLETLVDTIAHHLPQLEVLQIEHCNIFDIPPNIGQLNYLKKLIIDQQEFKF